MVELNPAHGGWIWRCEWSHIGFDFESEREALDDFLKHACDRSM